jgi:hypothetical protein
VRKVAHGRKDAAQFWKILENFWKNHVIELMYGM